MLFIPQILAAGHHLEAARSAFVASVSIPILVLLALRPSWFSYLVNVTFAIVTVGNVVKVWLFGGLLESGLEVIFGLLLALGALLMLGR
ncbi:MAG: hypothetical protein GTO33_12155, partial [Acidobacteria bacterium]|nr:hypothetical protein [Acidobacteriota bacterium]